MTVLPGSTLLGAVRVTEDSRATAPAWRAIVGIDAEPLSTYRAYLTKLGFTGNTTTNPNCKRKTKPSDRTGCASDFAARSPTGGTSQCTLELTSLNGDVTGHYLLVVFCYDHQSQENTASGDEARHETRQEPTEGAALVATPPHSPARRLRVGDAMPGDNLPGGPIPGDTGPAAGLGGGPYVLLPGTELIAKYGYGSYTGGFNVLLHLTGEVPADDVLDQYTVQSTQYAGEAPTRSTITEDNTIYKLVQPPGGAGGFQANLVLVDQPGSTSDYLFYDLAND